MKTKHIITTLLLLLTFTVKADYKGLHCITDPSNGSVYSLEKTDEGFRVTVNHLGGLGVIPISTSGDIQLGALDWVIKKSKVYKAMGEDYIVNFKSSECKISQSEMKGSCETENLAIGDVQISKFGFYFVLGQEIKSRRIIMGDISLTYQIRDTSPFFGGENGSLYMNHLLAQDLSFRQGCVFKGF